MLIFLCIVISELCAVSDEPIPSQTTYVEVDTANGVNHVLKNYEESEKNVISEKSVVAEKNVVVEKSVDSRQSATNHVNEAASSASSSIQKDAPKKSFASIVCHCIGSNCSCKLAINNLKLIT